MARHLRRRVGAASGPRPDLELFGGVGYETAAVPDATLDPAFPTLRACAPRWGAHAVRPPAWRRGGLTALRYADARQHRTQRARRCAEPPTRRADGGGRYTLWLGLSIWVPNRDSSVESRRDPIMTEPTPRSLVESLEASAAAPRSRAAFLTKETDAGCRSATRRSRAVDELRGGLAALGIGPRRPRRDHRRQPRRVGGRRLRDLRAGRRLVPMYESQLPSEWAFIARDARLSALFVSTAEIQARGLAGGAHADPDAWQQVDAACRARARPTGADDLRARCAPSALHGRAPRCTRVPRHGGAALHVGHDRRSQGRRPDPRQHSFQRGRAART